MGPLALYVRYTGISIRSQLQYRASFLMMSLGSLVTTGIEFLGIWALFSRFGNLRGWTLPQVGIFYGVINVGFALSEACGRGFDVFPNMVKSGDFDRVLLRPRSPALQIAAGDLQMMRIGRLTQGLIVLLWSCRSLHLLGSVPALAVMLSAVLCAFGVFLGLFVVQAALAFWTVETLEIMNTVTYGGTETAQYPLTIYRPWFRRFFTFVVPLACANYIPLQSLFAPGRPAFSPICLLSPLAGAAFLLASLQCWNIGVRHYRSTGS